jgi:hypothetical protein
MAFIVICDQCGKKEPARSDFDKPRHPVGWWTSVAPERVDVDVCGASCAAAMNDARSAGGRIALHWRYIERDDSRPVTESARLEPKSS